MVNAKSLLETGAGALALATLTCVLALVPSCQVDEEDFWQKVYRCDARAGSATCGTDREGEPMGCFPAHELGAADFCTEACDPLRPVHDQRFICKSPGALLTRCRPSAAARGVSECPEELECFPSDLAADEGICLLTCSVASDCAAPLQACDASQGSADCRPRGDRPTVCYEMTPLGGQDFCAQECDPLAAAEAGFACLRAGEGRGARVAICQLTVASDAAAGCPDGLRCYRTNFLKTNTEGLCLPMPVCNDGSDCPAERDCIADLVHAEYPVVSGLSIKPFLSNMQCALVYEPGQRDCPTGEVPIDTVTQQDVPNICVARCDQHPCPPTYTCVAEIEAAVPESFTCVPGLPGYRCSGKYSCLAGECVDTGAGFSVCTIPCMTDTTCNVTLSDFRGPYQCAAMPSGKHCLNVDPFRRHCTEDRHCDEGEHCSIFDPYDVAGMLAAKDLGECRAPCDAGTPCEKRGVMPFACSPKGECVPGVSNVPCSRDEECTSGLRCEAFDDEGLAKRLGSDKLCSIRCATDADCAEHPLSTDEICQSVYSVAAGTDLPGLCVQAKVYLK